MTASDRGSNIKFDEHDDVILEIDALNNNFLFDLTWYHNGSTIDLDDQFSLSSDNKTLSLTGYNISSNAGIYLAQYNKLFLHPYYNICQNEVLNLLRHYPVLKPVVFCVDIEYPCIEDHYSNTSAVGSLIVDYNFTSQGTDRNISLYAEGTLSSREVFRHSYLRLYWNERPLSLPSYPIEHFTIGTNFSEEVTQSGRYSVFLMLNTAQYLQSISCLPERDLTDVYNELINRPAILASAHVDIDNHEKKCQIPSYDDDTDIDMDDSISTAAIIGISIGVLVLIAVLVTIVTITIM